MAALYNATNGQHWINNTRWMKGDPCIDEWHGLYCIGGHVLQINIGFNNMSGALPAELAQADMLQVIQLYNNRLTGTIPAEILHMNSLQILNLRSNQLTGGLPVSISMPKLKPYISDSESESDERQPHYIVSGTLHYCRHWMLVVTTLQDIFLTFLDVASCKY